MSYPRAPLEAPIRELCRSAGMEVRRIEWIPPGLSLRHFARVITDSRTFPTLVARVDAPEDPAGRPAGVPPEPSLEPIRSLLERSGLPVPRRLACDPVVGIELLEDLGPTSLRDAASASPPPALAELYREACALVPRIQRIAPAPGVPAFDRVLDATLFAYKAELVIRHGLPTRGRPATSGEAATVRAAFAHIAAVSKAAPQRLAHRDYQSANLLVRSGAPPGGRLAMIDLQGALLAPPEYDLVCLLRDSYVELPEELVDELAERARAALPQPPPPEIFARRFDLLTLARKGKDHARFLYAARERGDERYLARLAPTLRYLRRAARRAARREPQLGALAELVHALPEVPCAR